MKEIMMWHELCALDASLKDMFDDPERRPDPKLDQKKLDALFRDVDMPFVKFCVENMLHKKSRGNLMTGLRNLLTGKVNQGFDRTDFLWNRF